LFINFGVYLALMNDLPTVDLPICLLFLATFYVLTAKKTATQTASFQDNLLSRYQEVKPSWISLHQEMIEMAVAQSTVSNHRRHFIIFL